MLKIVANQTPSKDLLLQWFYCAKLVMCSQGKIKHIAFGVQKAIAAMKGKQ